jgi:hypothetical protein
MRARRVVVPLAATTIALLAAAAPRASSPPCCAPVPAGIVAWWPGEGNVNDIVGGFNGTLAGGAGFVAAEVGQGFTFDSTDDLVKIGDAAQLYPGTGSFTVDAWIKTSGPDPSGGQAIVRHYECANFCTDADSSSNWELRVVNGKLWGFIRDVDKGGADGGGQVLTGATSIEDGTFHHIAMERDVSAGEMRLYVDGALDAHAALGDGASGNLANIDGDADDVTIGGGILGGTANPDPDVAFTGVIDEVDWFLAAVPQADLAAIAAAGPHGKCHDAVAPSSAATGPASSASASFDIGWTAADDAGGSGLANISLWVERPGDAAFTEVASQPAGAGSGTFHYSADAGDGDYAFFTTAEDASCGREAAPAQPDAVVKVAVPHPAPSASTPAPAPASTTTPAPPVVGGAGAAPAKVSITTIATLPAAHSCVSRRRLRIRLRGVKANQIVRAQITLNGKNVRTISGRALGLPIDLRGLPKGRFTVAITITTKSGARRVGTRRYRTCTPKRH